MRKRKRTPKAQDKGSHTDVTDLIRHDGDSVRTNPDENADKSGPDDHADKTIQRNKSGVPELAVDPDSTKQDTEADKTLKEKPPNIVKKK